MLNIDNVGHYCIQKLLLLTIMGIIMSILGAYELFTLR